MEVELRNMIANVGFPIAVSIFLLIRIENKLSTLSESINGLSKIIESAAQKDKQKIKKVKNTKLIKKILKICKKDFKNM